MVEPLPDWAPDGVDVTTASAARMYDYFLGGPHNFDVDRQVARQVLALVPDIQEIVQANRAFLHRAVRYLLAQGIRQFIDLGSGIPSVGNVHDTVGQSAAGVRVLYVDHDPVAVAHTARILRDNPDAQVLEADLLRPEMILDSADLIDFSQPVGVLMVSVLHFIAEEDRPQEAIRQFRERVAAGSYLAVSQVTSDGDHPQAEAVTKLYESSANPITRRTRTRIVELFDGWELVEPGAVWVPEWHPDQPLDNQDPSSTSLIAAVGRKP